MGRSPYITVIAMPALLLLCMNAHASVVSYTRIFSNEADSQTTTTGSYASAFDTTYSYVDIDRFDSSLGILTGVNISVSSRWGHYTRVEAEDHQSELEGRDCNCHEILGQIICICDYLVRVNDTSVSSRGELYLAAQLIGPSGVAAEATFLDVQLLSCSDSMEEPVPVEGQLWVDCNDPGGGGYFTDLGVFNDSLDLSQLGLDYFIGSDPIKMQLQNFTYVNAFCDNDDGGDECRIFGSSWWRGTVTVSYSYTGSAVPEPSSAALFCPGLAGLGFAMRRRVALS